MVNLFALLGVLGLVVLPVILGGVALLVQVARTFPIPFAVGFGLFTGTAYLLKDSWR
jgi:hypothetical protein